MIELLGLIKAAACAMIFWRIYTYHWPKDSTYRFGVTVVAYCLMFLVGGQAISLTIGAPMLAPYFDAGIYIAFLVLVMMAKGNIANILKMNFSWDGSERRGRH